MKAIIDQKKKLWFSFPISCNEITWKQFSEIRAIEQKFFKLNTPKKEVSEDDKEGVIKEQKEKPQPPAAALTNIKKSVGHVIALLDIVCDGCWGDELPFTIEGDDMKKLFARKFTYDMETAFTEDLSLMRLYVHIVNMIDKYKPEEVPTDFKIKWKGVTYMIDPTEAFKALNGIDYAAGETLTLLEFQKKTLESIEKKGDPHGNMAFNLGIQEVAILLRKKGERLPYKRRERISFINERGVLFQDLPLDIFLNVRFFFLHILKTLGQILTTNSSLKGLKAKRIRVQAISQKRQQKRSGKPRGKS